MNTCVRRFLLRLVVGLLTFALGVGVAMLLGGFRPFQSFASSPNYMNRGQSDYQRLMPEPAYQYPVYHEHGCKMKKRMSELPPPPPPPAEAPLAPASR